MKRLRNEAQRKKPNASCIQPAALPRFLLGPEALLPDQATGQLIEENIALNNPPCEVTVETKNPTVKFEHLTSTRGYFVIYIGIDISSKEFIVHAVNGKKKVVLRGEKIKPTRQGLKRMLDSLGSEQKVVVFEAGNQLKWIALYLKSRKDIELHVVHPNELKWIHQSSKKTDKVDARKMAELARIDGLPRKVHIVEGKIRNLRELIAARVNIMRKRVALINSIHGYMKQEGVKLPTGFFQSKNWQDDILKIKVGGTRKIIIKNFMYSLEQMRLAEEGIEEEIYKVEDQRLELLESIPSIGKMASRVILSALDDANRFDNKKAVAKYGALTPRVYQSGDKTHLGRIGRDGRHELRRVLLQCSHTINRMSKNHSAKPLYDFSQKIVKKRNKKIAAVATSRKLLTIAYGVLKSGESYNPEVMKPYRKAA